ncbi:uncharacterized protein LOC115443438 [Manduca sexta]|uniref:uncharacterized protein LOC115443438 n=1 Tax=Manduca sexta TaxID=7130 RepID=UPI0011839488|nr:uncharacterized protein LOC115443438 [Manduca sexta]
MKIAMLYYILFFLLAHATANLRYRRVGEPNYEISFYEYGSHIKGQVVSYTYNGVIPALTPIHHLIAKPIRPDVEQRFTYLRVEYVSPLSKVSISLNPANFTLTFHVRFPFIDIPLGIVGYSLPLK